MALCPKCCSRRTPLGGFARRPAGATHSRAESASESQRSDMAATPRPATVVSTPPGEASVTQVRPSGQAATRVPQTRGMQLCESNSRDPPTRSLRDDRIGTAAAATPIHAAAASLPGDAGRIAFTSHADNPPSETCIHVRAVLRGDRLTHLLSAGKGDSRPLRGPPVTTLDRAARWRKEAG